MAAENLKPTVALAIYSTVDRHGRKLDLLAATNLPPKDYREQRV